MKTFYLFSLLLILLAGNIAAQGVVTFNYVWTGGGNNDAWENADNWSGPHGTAEGNPDGWPKNTHGVIIPNLGNTGFEHYPILPYDISLAALIMKPGSRLTINNNSLIAIEPYRLGGVVYGINGVVEIDGAIISNPFSLQFNGSECAIRNSTFGIHGLEGVTGYTSGKAIIRFNGSGSFTEAGNTFKGDVETEALNDRPLRISWEGSLAISYPSDYGGGTNLSYNGHSVYEKGLTVKRTASAGETFIFSGAAAVHGNLTYSNPFGGNTYIGSTAGDVSVIGGYLEYSYASTNPGNVMQIRRTKNLTSGGSISFSGAYRLDMQYDTLRVPTATFEGVSNNFVFRYNQLQGNFSLSDHATHTTHDLSFTDNTLIGNATFDKHSTSSFYEGGNTFTGTSVFNIHSQASIFMGSPASTYGSLKISRDVHGGTDIFRTYGAVVNGDFSFQSPGYNNGVFIGNNTTATTIQGKVDIKVSGLIPKIYNLHNETGGGKIRLVSCNMPELRNCSLVLDSLVFDRCNTEGLAYTSVALMTGNHIDGIVDVSTFLGTNSYNGGVLLVQENIFEKDCAFSSDGAKVTIHFDDTDGATENTPNHFKGNLKLSRNFYTNNWGNPVPCEPIYLGSADSSYIYKDLKLSGDIIPGNKIRFVSGSNTLLESDQAPLTIAGFTVDKSGTGKIILAQPTRITGTLTFTNGIVKSSETHPLIFTSTAAQTGASPSSYVEGKMSRAGSGDFTFPAGDGNGKFAMVTLTGISGANEQFSVIYHAQNPQSAGYNPNALSEGLEGVLSTGFWEIVHEAGSSTPQVALHYNLPAGYISDHTSLVVAHWNDDLGKWESLGNGGTTGDNLVGSVKTLGPVTNFSPFTIGSVSKDNNPLPVRLASFSAKALRATVELRWETVMEENTAFYGIERSFDGYHFEHLARVNAGNNASSKTYIYTDEYPAGGRNFYRLKMTDTDGSFVYSPLVAAEIKSGGQVVVFPNPAVDFITVKAPAKGASVTVLSLDGRRVLSLRLQSENERIPVDRLPAGMYVVQVEGGAYSQVIRFVKD